MAAAWGLDRITLPSGPARGRCLGLSSTVFALCLFGATPAGAQRCAPGTITLSVEGQSIGLAQSHVTRIPYNRDMTAWVAPEAGKKAAEVVVRYAVTSAGGGERTTLVAATPTSDSTCWSAGLPRIHLNESGKLSATLYVRPEYRTDQSAETLVARFLLALTQIPGGTDRDTFVRAVSEAAERVVSNAFRDPEDVVVMTGTPPVATPLAARLAEMLRSEIGFANVISGIKRSARLLSESADELLEHPEIANAPARSCRLGGTLQEVRSAANQMMGTDADFQIVQRIASGDLPWPECVVTVVDSLPDIGGEGADAKRVREAARDLAHSAGLVTLGATAMQAREMTEISAHVETLNVPFGSGLLERYTQVDVVTATIPDMKRTLQFAAATWYVFSSAPGTEFTASVDPGSDGTRTRFGIQVGYPIGVTVGTPPEDAPDFKPQYLVGLIGRLNAVLSASGGWVIGSVGSARRVPYFLSLNVDLSNLGPLQQIFARRDSN